MISATGLKHFATALSRNKGVGDKYYLSNKRFVMLAT